MMMSSRVLAAAAALFMAVAPASATSNSGWSMSCDAGCTASRGVIDVTLDPTSGAPILSLACQPAGAVVLSLPDNRAFGMEAVLGRPMDAYWQSQVSKRNAALLLERRAQIAAQISLAGIDRAIADLRARTGTQAQQALPSGAGGHMAAMAQAASHTQHAPKIVPQFKPQVHFAIGADTLAPSNTPANMCQ